MNSESQQSPKELVEKIVNTLSQQMKKAGLPTHLVSITFNDPETNKLTVFYSIYSPLEDNPEKTDWGIAADMNTANAFFVTKHIYKSMGNDDEA